MKTLSEPEIKTRIDACWLGKAIGGTLGAPYEGHPGPLDLDFYRPVPEGILPNDDLDLQVVWLRHLLNTQASDCAPARLAPAWKNHVHFPFDEYAVCRRNIEYGLSGSQLGSADNWFSECMGAAIRSELWACLAPGEPERAAGMAWNDAVCDHAGDGVWAEIFFAALESAAFVENNPERLLDLALDLLPSHSRVKQSVTDTRRWWAEERDWLVVRQNIHQCYGSDNFTDVSSNIAYTILGWLAGEGDFGRSLCFAANCGADTDCTAATLGSLLGILNPGAIPPRWSQPVGEKIILSPQIQGITAPENIAALTRLTLDLRKRFIDYRPLPGCVTARQPATPENPLMDIPVSIAWSDDPSLLKAARPHASHGNEVAQSLPGHWLQRHRDDFSGSVMLLRYHLHLEKAQPVLLGAWSQSTTALWLNGERLVDMPLHPTIPESRYGAPSFHRGGRGFRGSPGALPAGQHDVVVAWERPDPSIPSADLLIGAANATTCQWLPYGIGKMAPQIAQAALA